MDVSPEYVKKCEKAKEFLRPYWRWQDGDFIYSPETQRVRTIFYLDKVGDTVVKFALSPMAEECEADKTYIWLPRQDQLQEMVMGNAPEKLRRLVHLLYTMVTVSCDTMEQFWLALVMWEKYQKTWNWREWVTN